MKNFNLIRVAALFVFLFCLCLPASSQSIDSTLAKYADDYGQERIYLQYDKSTYAPGETIWYKVYLLKGFFPEDVSKTLYTDWTDDKGNLLFRSVSPVVDGTTNGQIDIPNSYSGKYIHVKAYTRWMLNFDSAFLYNKDIRVLNKTAQQPAVKNTVISMLQFFPEGGDAVSGVVNKIAFIANDQWGRPVNIKGVIQNNQGKIIDSLRVIHDGMGYFFIRPEPGETFTAKWKDGNGVTNTTPLPLVKNTGISLQVAISGSMRNFEISASADEATRLKKINLIGTLNQHEVFKVTKDISGGSAKGIIPTGDLPSGILTITAFDEQWNPLAERITYINNEEYLFHPEMSVQHWGLNKRARNEIEIDVPDSLQANLAVSVTDASIDADSSDNIISHLLLAGDIKGEVYNPAYYFSNTSDSISRQLDLVMLTHGWRRFKWDDVVKGKFPVINYPKDSSYLTLSGRLYGALPSELRQGGTIVLIVSQKKNDGKMILLPIEPNGTFNDPSQLIFDTAHIYYQLPKKRFEDVSVRFMEGLLPPLRNRMSALGIFNNTVGDTTGNFRHYQLADEMTKLLQQYEGKVLENVTVTAKTKSPLDIMDQKYTSGLFAGGDSYQFDMVNDPTATALPDIFHYLQARVAGLQINTNAVPVSLLWRGGAPELFVDEVQTDVDMVASIPVGDIAYVKVFRPPFMAGFGGANGAIAIYTRRGDDVKPVPGKGLSNIMVTGYSVIRQFYAPNYDSYKPENEKKDVRTTLYWNPQVVTTPGKNKVILTFYNNDVTKSFRVVIEGMTKDGQLAHVEQIME
ncbi:MAG TPA: hypothetical protein VET23_14620 [Chitinophagaceae bacterium]|nr:hypothetical protein [Chitinophagaceae bacterium]